MSIRNIVFFYLIVFSCVKLTGQDKEINALNFGISPEKDATPIIRNALYSCVKNKANRLTIPYGIYHFYPDKAIEKYVNVSNNDGSKKRIIFPIDHMNNFEIDGNGSLFIMHGEVSVFDICDSKNIKLVNFSINWAKPFNFQAQVVAVNPSSNSFDLKVSDECDYEIVADELIFLEKPGLATKTWKDWAKGRNVDVGWERNIDWNAWIDPVTKAGVLNGNLYEIRTYNEKLKTRYRAEELEKGLVRFYNSTNRLPAIGWILVCRGMGGLERACPALHISNVENFKISDVNVFHAGGMGLIAEKCNGIMLKRFNTILPPNSNRVVTTTADATHFVNCKGLIKIDSCIFENMLDDAANVHGIYVAVDGLVDNYTLGLRIMHIQQSGFQFTSVGDTIALTDNETLVSFAKLRVKSVRIINSEYMEVVFTEKIDKVYRPNCSAENLSWQPNLVMNNCVVRRNRARSILISTRGDVLIEKNNFNTSTFTSILFEGESSFWYESGPVRNVIIRNNRFKDFGLYGGNAPILQFSPHLKIKDSLSSEYYHKNILFENNEIDVFSRLLVYALSVENLIIRGNKITKSEDYPQKSVGPVFNFDHCNNILIENNTYLFNEQATIIKDKWTKGLLLRNNRGISDILLSRK